MSDREPAPISVTPQEAEAQLAVLRTRYWKELADIEQTRKNSSQSAEEEAHRTQSTHLRRGMAGALSGDVEKIKQEKIAHANVLATRQRMIASLQFKKDTLVYSRVDLEEVLDHYARYQASTTSPGSISQAREKIVRSFQSEEALLQSLGNLDEATDDQLQVIFTSAELAHRIRTATLAPFARRSIQEQEEELEKIEHSLATLPSNEQSLTPAHPSLARRIAQDRVSYFAARATSPQKAIMVALASAKNLEEEIAQRENILQRLESYHHEDYSKHCSELQWQIRLLKQAHRAYHQVALDHAFEFHLDDNLQEQAATLDGALVSESAQEALHSLRSLLPAQEELTKSISVHLLLKTIQEIPENQQDFFLCGVHGGLQLVAPEDLKEQTPRSIFKGMSLLRLAIFQEYGSEGLHRFDLHFDPEISKEQTIRPRDLLLFLQEEDLKNPKAFYLSSVNSMDQLMQPREEALEEATMIKASSSAFSLNSSKDTPVTRFTKKQEREHILEATQAAILEMFSQLPKEEQQLILFNFQRCFNKDGEVSLPLTMKNLKLFLQEEAQKKGSFWGRVDILGPAMNSLAWQLFHASVTPIIMGPHLGYWSRFFILLGMGIFHDLTMTWRQARVE